MVGFSQVDIIYPDITRTIVVVIYSYPTYLIVCESQYHKSNIDGASQVCDAPRPIDTPKSELAMSLYRETTCERTINSLSH